MTITDQELAKLADKAVAEGAAWLDEHKPGWRALISRELDVSDCKLCTLGQVYGHYIDAPTAARWNPLNFVATRRGFDHGEIDGTFVSYTAMTAAWKRLLGAPDAAK